MASVCTCVLSDRDKMVVSVMNFEEVPIPKDDSTCHRFMVVGVRLEFLPTF